LCKLFTSVDDFEEVISELESPTSGSRIDRLPGSKRGSILAGIREVLCEYFDVLRLGDAPLYRQFAEQVLTETDTVISLNYDVSLKAELRKAGKWHIGDGYGFPLGHRVTPASPVRVLKLHGSTNWIDILFQRARGGKVGPDDALGARPLILPQEFQFFGYPKGIRDPAFTGGGSSRSGSMILPARIKTFGDRKGFWDCLWSLAAGALQNADEIVIIGYSLPSADKRARDLVFDKGNKRAAPISICCGLDSPKIEGQFTDAGFTHVETRSSHFDDWLCNFLKSK